jgi:hypothetical protein
VTNQRFEAFYAQLSPAGRIRPESFSAGREGIGALVVRVDAGTCEVLGSTTLVRAAVGTHQVAVRLLGVADDIPERVSAPIDALHVFAAETGARIGP